MKGQGSELASVLLADLLQGASWPGSEKAQYPSLGPESSDPRHFGTSAKLFVRHIGAGAEVSRHMAPAHLGGPRKGKCYFPWAKFPRTEIKS